MEPCETRAECDELRRRVAALGAALVCIRNRASVPPCRESLAAIWERADAELRQDVEPRPEVMEFARAMEERLRANEHKGGWKHIHRDVLATMLQGEVDELLSAIRAGADNAIRDEAADVANFAMMLVDVCGGLVA